MKVVVLTVVLFFQCQIFAKEIPVWRTQAVNKLGCAKELAQVMRLVASQQLRGATGLTLGFPSELIYLLQGPLPDARNLAVLGVLDQFFSRNHTDATISHVREHFRSESKRLTVVCYVEGNCSLGGADANYRPFDSSLFGFDAFHGNLEDQSNVQGIELPKKLMDKSYPGVIFLMRNNQNYRPANNPFVVSTDPVPQRRNQPQRRRRPNRQNSGNNSNVQDASLSRPSRNLPPNVNEIMEEAQRVLHEATHAADFQLFKRWLRAAVKLEEKSIGDQRRDLLLENENVIRKHDGKWVVDAGFWQVFMESRGFFTTRFAWHDFGHQGNPDRESRQMAMDQLRAMNAITGYTLTHGVPGIMEGPLDENNIFEFGWALGEHLQETVDAWESLKSN